MRSFILLGLPFALAGLYLVGSWMMHMAKHFSWWMQYGDASLMSFIVHNNARWWQPWEYHVAMTSLIACSAGIVSLILHLVLPRGARHHD